MTFLLSELEHAYGNNVHLLSNPYLGTILAKLCSPGTFQPLINDYVENLYSSLIEIVVNREFLLERMEVPTRMTAFHSDHLLKGLWIQSTQKAVVVNIARAGTYPSHVCYNALHNVINAENIRQDHIFAARTTDDQEKVIGASLSGTKIGGRIDDAIILFPDPMGATGNTIISSIEFYKNRVEGEAKKIIVLHLIVTPEYLRNITTHHPDVIVYAIRLDRGLSPQAVLNTKPGTHWDEERGLNDKQYIVPGGGGFGEIMNNSFV